MKVKDSYNCDAISIVAATAAIEDQEYAGKRGSTSSPERQRVIERADAAGLDGPAEPGELHPRHRPRRPRAEAYLGLKQQGILVRYFDKPGLTDKIRITDRPEPGEQRAARRDQGAEPSTEKAA